MVAVADLPDFKSLPPVQGMPHGCAWGLFDIDGKRDNLGTLNLLTPEVVLAAKEEIKTGISISVNWPLNKVHRPGFKRKVPEHRIINLQAKPGDGHPVHDDELHINTQSGSQWDGFKHFGHGPSECYYNGLKHADVPTSLDNGIHHWNDRGGIVGRGVLLDYVRYAEKKGIEYDVMTRHQITVDILDDMAKDQGVEFKPGDVLIIRSGFTKWYESASQEERDAKITGTGDSSKLAWAGVEGSIETAEWLWNHHFSAVAGDSISFEQWPMNPKCKIHEFQLAFWGSPIGEIWDLEKLAEVCDEQKRWSFFFTSAPLNVVGGVASPPNALAIL
ncbi:hypothetical protein LTR36_001282 [Oleoguttula mirabilis]|uniref:Cyclase n=1 Tax=Oleoguttula mirabilis TaxID=1507867 RepID=A0AAV9JP16_9PEZI|nr:hypothetical protein LTR36_001282 [Oleoguttula mirabilis]